MEATRTLIDKARIFAQVEGKTLPEKIHELLKDWVDVWEIFLEKNHEKDIPAGKVVSLDAHRIHRNQ